MHEHELQGDGCTHEVRASGKQLTLMNWREPAAQPTKRRGTRLAANHYRTHKPLCARTFEHWAQSRPTSCPGAPGYWNVSRRAILQAQL